MEYLIRSGLLMCVSDDGSTVMCGTRCVQPARYEVREHDGRLRRVLELR